MIDYKARQAYLADLQKRAEQAMKDAYPAGITEEALVFQLCGRVERFDIDDVRWVMHSIADRQRRSVEGGDTLYFIESDANNTTPIAYSPDLHVKADMTAVYAAIRQMKMARGARFAATQGVDFALLSDDEQDDWADRAKDEG